MVLILDGRSKHQTRVWRKQDFYEINLRFATALDLNKYLKQLKLPISLHTYSPISELPPNIIIMRLKENQIRGTRILKQAII